MRIVDSQIHIWSGGLPGNQAHRQVTAFTAEEAIALMDEGGVDAAVIHPPSWGKRDDMLAEEAVKAYPGRFAIMGKVPLEDPASRTLVATWRDQPGNLGLRYGFLRDPERTWIADATLEWLWDAAEQAGVPIAMLATDSLKDVAGFAVRHPWLRLTFDHLGGGGGYTRLKVVSALVLMQDLIALSTYPNVAVKATGAPGYSSGEYPYTSMHPYLKQIFDAFGPQRMFWGTDISKMPCSWRQCVTMFTEELPWLKGDDLEQVMGKAVCSWWGWER
jgi:predicted TIM-barrel fold metal-dependent hydrolase